MKKCTTIVLVLIATIAVAQDQYTKGMQKAFLLWGEGKPMEASNMFERISAVEKDNWLPAYYTAQVNTVISFGEKDKDRLERQLKKAQDFVDKAAAISPSNPEILVQQAMIHTAYVAFDGVTYGGMLSPEILGLYNKALAIAPNNPRVVFSKAEWDMGTAKYFGQDTTPFCAEVERSLELFATFKPASAFYPNWGKGRAEITSKTCIN